MVDYYLYWEKCILNAITKAILKSIITLNELFSLDSNPLLSTAEREKYVLFVVKAKFISYKEILYNPSIPEIDSELKNRLVNSFKSTGKEFIRWMAATCKSPNIEGVTLGEKIKEYIRDKYSYGTEIEKNKDIKNLVPHFIHNIEKIRLNLEDNKLKYTNEYNQSYFGHWGQTARAKYETQLERNKTLKNFEKTVASILFN